MTVQSLYSKHSLFVYLNALIQAFLFSLIMPTLSYFLAEHFQQDGFYIGLLFIGFAVSGIVIARWMGPWSDKHGCRKSLISTGSIAGALVAFGFAYSPSYWFVLALSVTLFGYAFATIAQIFALARDYSEKVYQRDQLVMFNSIVRACGAVAWVAGPAIGFLLIDAVGFEKHYTYLAVCYLLAAGFSQLTLPDTSLGDNSTSEPEEAQSTQILYLPVVVMALIFGCNQSYLIALPILITQELNLGAHWAGWLMGTAAALEIPVMIAAAWLAARMPIIYLIRAGVASAATLYLGVWLNDSLVLLFALQLFNAIFIGCIAGLGITWFQDLLPGRTGVASSYFWIGNSAGNIVGAAIIMVFIGMLSYQQVFAVNVVIALITLGLLYTKTQRSKHSRNTGLDDSSLESDQTEKQSD